MILRKFALVAALVLMAGGAQAVNLRVIGGELHGASNVLVDGSLYNVQFRDGTCVDLYNGCDDASDFTFQTLASATLASQALLDQVFVDGASGNFSSSPDLTFSCGPDPSYCFVFTPYDSLAPLPEVTGRWAHNSSDNTLDVLTGPGVEPRSTPFSSFSNTILAVWAPAPVVAVPMSSTPVMLLILILMVATGFARTWSDGTGPGH
jgi:hypothetical protein